MLKRFIENFKNNNLKLKKTYYSLPEQNDRSFIKKLSKQAIGLYERQKDIEKFTKIALSEKNSPAEENLIKDLLRKGVIEDAISNDDINSLLENRDFLNDLGIE